MPQSSGSLTIAIPAFAHPTEKLPLNDQVSISEKQFYKVLHTLYFSLLPPHEDESLPCSSKMREVKKCFTNEYKKALLHANFSKVLTMVTEVPETLVKRLINQEIRTVLS